MPTDHIARFTRFDLEAQGELVILTIGGVNRTFITSLKKIERVSFEKIDYISDSRLIKYYAKAGFGKGQVTLGKNEAIKLSQLIDAYKKKHKGVNNDSRLKRLESVMAEFLEYEGYGKDIIENFLLHSMEGRKYLDGYFDENKDLLIKEKIDEIEAQTQKKKESIQKEINEINRIAESRRKELEEIEKNVSFARVKAEEEVKKIREQTEEQAHQSLLQKQERLTNENTELENQLRVLQSQCHELINKYEDLQKVGNLKEEIQYLTRSIHDKQKERMDIERTLQSQRNFIASPQIGDRLTELKTLIQMLNGKPNYSAGTDTPSVSIIKSKTELTKQNRTEYIQYLISSFHSDEGRPFTFDEMANLVICTNQSFLTILAGPPGTGKTSTAHRLAKAMSLNGNDEQEAANFLSVSVGRGWVSGRDILGFYNSLKDVYQPSRSGLYQFLRNKDKASDGYTKLVLLDEANLSSVEHYWSDFLGMCDPEVIKRRIDLGIPDSSLRYLEVGSNVRFVATINNDATTEKLSPRLIDRAPIISLANDTLLSEIPPLSSRSFDGAILQHQLSEVFDVSSSEADLLPDEQASLDQIITILSTQVTKASSVHISKRKINAIKRYCHVANELPEMRNRPLDYAVAQHILPLIEGHGSAFKDRLLKLEQKLSEFDLNLSKKTLRGMIEEGDSYAETYSYF